MSTASNNIDLKLTLSGLSVVEGGLKTLTGTLHGLKEAALGGTAAFGVERLLEFTKHSIEAASQMGNLAKKLGGTTEEMSRLAYAARSGSEELQKMGDEGLQRLLGRFARFQSMHGKGSESLTDSLMDLSEQFQHLPDGATKAAIAIERFGRGGLDMIPFLDRGPEGIRKLMEQAEHLGVVTEKDAAISRSFRGAMYDLEYSTHHLSMTIGMALAPALTEGAKAMTEVVACLREIIEASPFVQHAIEAITVAVVSMTTAFAVAKAGAMAGFASSAAALSKVMAVIGAAFVGWDLGRAIGGMNLYGKTVDEHVTMAWLRAAWAFERFRYTLGAGNLASLQELAKTMADLDKPKAGKSADGKSAPGMGLGSKQEMEDKRKLLELTVQENKLMGERTHKTDQGADADEARYQALDREADSIEAKRKLSLEARDKGLIDSTEYRELELADNRELLALEKERWKIAAESDKEAVKNISERLAVEHELLQAHIASIDANFRMSDVDKRDEKLKRYAEAMTKLKDESGLFDKDSAGITNPAQMKEIEAGRKLYAHRMSALDRQRGSLQDSADLRSMKDQFRGTVSTLQNEWGTFAKQAAAAFSSVFNSAVSSISNGITGLIMRTETWGQALRQIGTSILTSIVGAIVNMGVRWVATQLMMAIAGKAILAAGTSAMIPLAAAQSAIWATPATLATISSYGAAASAAPGFIAMAEGITLSESLASFSSGGYTGDGGTNDFAGNVHGREYVFSAPATAHYGVGNLDAMHKAGINGDSAKASGGVNVAIFDDRSKMKDWAKSREGKTVLMDTVGKNLHEIS